MQIRGSGRCVLAAGLSVFLAAATIGAQTPSWPQWRGPARDGTATFDAPAVWPPALTRVWDAVVGEGHASPVIVGSHLVVHTRVGEREVVWAFDLASGALLWRSAYDAPYRMNPAARAHGPGPKSTPAVANGRVFTLGISGVLSALDLESGRTLWRTPASTSLPLYGTATSPLVDGERVIAFMGGHDNGALTAFEAATGEVRWRWAGDGPGYASPVIAELDGARHLVTQSQGRPVGVSPADGALLWEVPLRTSFDQNSVTPIVVNGLIVSSGLEHPTIAYRVARGPSGWRAQEVWRNERVSMYMSSPAATAQAIFGLSHRNRGQFVAFDPATAGEIIVARASAERFDEARRYVVAESATWAHPALAGRTMAVKDVDRLIVWKVEG